MKGWTDNSGGKENYERTRIKRRSKIQPDV